MACRMSPRFHGGNSRRGRVYVVACSGWVAAPGPRKILIVRSVLLLIPFTMPSWNAQEFDHLNLHSADGSRSQIRPQPPCPFSSRISPRPSYGRCSPLWAESGSFVKLHNGWGEVVHDSGTYVKHILDPPFPAPSRLACVGVHVDERPTAQHRVESGSFLGLGAAQVWRQLPPRKLDLGRPSNAIGRLFPVARCESS